MNFIRLALILFIVLWGAYAVNSQTVDCPPDKVCISLDQARKYLAMEDEKKVLEKEILVVRQALLDQKEVTVDVKIQLARVMGEKTGAEQENVRLVAEKEMLLKLIRKRCSPFSICVN